MSNVAVETKHGDCSRWPSKGQCSKGDACSFKHDEEKGKRKIRNPTRCPRDPNRYSEGDGKGTKGKGPKGSPSGKRDQPACYKFTPRKCTNPCDYWHPPECVKFKTKDGCRLGDRCSFVLSGDCNEQGNKQKKHSKPDKATSACDERQ